MPSTPGLTPSASVNIIIRPPSKKFYWEEPILSSLQKLIELSGAGNPGLVVDARFDGQHNAFRVSCQFVSGVTILPNHHIDSGGDHDSLESAAAYVLQRVEAILGCDE